MCKWKWNYWFDSTKLEEKHLSRSAHVQDDTTLLGLLITISQLYAAISCSKSRFDLIVHQGAKKLMHLSRVADALGKYYENLKKEDPKETDDGDD